ncbi:1-deoxy-D-xylulose-5-phosphate synthase [Streptomyces sp. NPDC052236]|uniref:1-deoxy-D-xylulose-5-phosphate synthase n=1 Tax=Streptomyces sp. NPDC052236 TaxID=3365686 RepID=UPI0037D23EDC
MTTTTTEYPLLSQVFSPKHLGTLTEDDLSRLADEARAFLIEKVSATGGHLGPNLGMVELSLALHRVFSSPTDTIVFDTGHQAYVHKILTGRASSFDTLRQEDGLSGYPSRAESVHDIIENSHASTALSWADGIAKGRRLAGETDRRVIAVVGDGAMTGGMCWEALNNLASGQDLPVIVVLNDNERSYAPTIGGLADHLAALRTEHPDGIDWLTGIPEPADGTSGPLPVARSLFELLGLAYIGPVDGHQLPSIEEALHIAKDLRRPVVVHVVTVKGKGHGPSEADAAECFHAVPAIDSATGTPLSKPTAPSWTSAFSTALIDHARTRPGVVAITAAMPGPTGLTSFGRHYPDRFFDVGIAEQHAVTSAAGLALAGMHPVVAVYATFLGRAFDQVLMDVALHRAPVTFVLDRSGVTGPDGPSHHGMWDLTILGAVPGMRVAAPRDAVQLGQLLAEALDHTDGPTALRFPKASAADPVEARERYGTTDILARTGRDVLILATGPLCAEALKAAALLDEQHITSTVADPRWLYPIAPEIISMAARHRLVVTVEDNTRAGGYGTHVARTLAEAGLPVSVRALGLPGRFLPHGSRASLLGACGLTPIGITHSVLKARAGFPITQE